MSNNPKLRVSPFGLIAPATEQCVEQPHHARPQLPCSRARRMIRTALRPESSWLASCIAAEESELDDTQDPVSLH
jgi:hypothetical protein